MNTTADILKVENEKVNISEDETPFKELSDVKLPFASIKLLLRSFAVLLLLYNKEYQSFCIAFSYPRSAAF